eukprot:m.80925 g.80925  ORF g.80925 m.80925 type:complete len:356 (-) comp12785_c0_seq6:2247-3314(-)
MDRLIRGTMLSFVVMLLMEQCLITSSEEPTIFPGPVPSFTQMDVTKLIKSWESQCDAAQHDKEICRMWSNKVDEAHRGLLRLSIVAKRHIQLAKGTFKFFVKNSVSHFEPVWTCDINEKIPLEANQGSSWTCGVSTLTPKELVECACTVFVFGKGTDTVFARGLKAARPECCIHGFDTLAEKAQRKRVLKDQATAVLKFHSITLKGKGKRSMECNGCYSFADVMKKYLPEKSKYIAVLKLDLHGMEYEVMNDIGERCRAGLRIGQIIVNLYLQGAGYGNTIPEKEIGGNATKVYDIGNLFSRLLFDCNMLIYSKRPNQMACDNFRCYEYAFIEKAEAFKVFCSAQAHCNGYVDVA